MNRPAHKTEGVNRTKTVRFYPFGFTSTDEGGIAAYYNYSADGERNIKLTSPRLNIQQNATLFNNPPLVYPTLYASSLVTLTKQGYTKHYFEEGRRVCSKLGGGMRGNVTVEEIDSRVPELTYNYDDQFRHQYDGIHQTFHDCIRADPQIIDGVNLHKMLIDRELRRDNDEPAFFYHGDHLGSAAYLTYHGDVTQTLNYLPYGEDWIDVQNNMDPRLGIYRFNGKEKDYESGFHYYGARYYWSEVLTGWLSVDPMADKYPNISPYNYCMWNPIKLIDPDGRDTIKINLNEGSFEQTRADGNHSVQFYKDGELAYSDEIEKDNCSFLVSKPEKLSYIENGEEKDATTNHLYCTNSETGELIFKKIAELGSPVEWDYYSRKTGNLDLSMGDLSSSGLKDKMIHGLGQYTKRNVNYWDHYHPNNHSESFFPSYSDQRHARELGGVRCTMFNNGRSMNFNNYVPSKEGGYINVNEFRMLWDRFAR